MKSKLQRFSLAPVILIVSLSLCVAPVSPAALLSPSQKWKLFYDLVNLGTNDGPSKITKVVFPFPEDVIMNRSFLPNLGLLTDLVFLFMPAFPATGLVKLSRDLFESEECVQYVSCEVTKYSQDKSLLKWIPTLLQQFPFDGETADRIKFGSRSAVRMTPDNKNGIARMTNVTIENKQETVVDILQPNCGFSCNPVASMSKGLKVFQLLSSLAQTVKN